MAVLRKMSSAPIILALLLVALPATVGCTRCRNFFHRGAACGTTTVAPATLSAPVALTNPAQQPAAPAAPAPATAAPTMVAPPVICCPQPCFPCVPCDPCVPCEPYCVEEGCIEEGCSDCSPITTYDGTYPVQPSTTDPYPSGEN